MAKSGGYIYIYGREAPPPKTYQHTKQHPQTQTRTNLRLGGDLVREEEPDEGLRRGLALAGGALGGGELLLQLRDAVPAEADALGLVGG